MMDDFDLTEQTEQMNVIAARMQRLLVRHAQFLDYNYMGMVGLDGGI